MFQELQAKIENTSLRIFNTKSEHYFGSISILSKEISNIKKGEPIPVNQFSDCVTQACNSSDVFEVVKLVLEFKLVDTFGISLHKMSLLSFLPI